MPKNIQSIVGKTIKAVRTFDTSEPVVEIEFTDGTKLEILDTSKRQLEWAFHFGDRDNESVSGLLGQ